MEQLWIGVQVDGVVMDAYHYLLCQESMSMVDIDSIDARFSAVYPPYPRISIPRFGIFHKKLANLQNNLARIGV